MKTIYTASGKEIHVDDEDFGFLSVLPWRICRGYAMTSIKVAFCVWENQYMHRIVMGLKKGDGILIDHKDRNKRNNCKHNLRVCNEAQNSRNRKKAVNNTSGFKGVSKHGKKWEAKIKVNGKTRYLGRRSTPEEAYEIYTRAALELHGEFASLE